MRVRCIGPLEYISDTHADTVPFVLQTHFLPLRPALRNPVKNMANDELSHRMPFDGSSNSAMPASLPHTQVPHKTLAEISAAFFPTQNSQCTSSPSTKQYHRPATTKKTTNRSLLPRSYLRETSSSDTSRHGAGNFTCFGSRKK